MTKIHFILSSLILILTAYFFQNCSRVTFETAPISLQSLSSTGGDSQKSCSQAKPPDSELIFCPVDAGNRPLKNSVKRTREIKCINGEWIAGPWRSTPISDCGCAVTEQLPDPITGLCQCPNSKILINGRCETPLCDPLQRQSTSESKLCTDGINKISRARTETCNTSNYQWEYSDWSSWNYSQCTCAIAGQMVQSNGACACPEGKYIIGNTCGTCPAWQNYNPTTRLCTTNTCDPNVKPAASEGKLCSYGTNFAARVCDITCDRNTFAWQKTNCSPWNYSDCQCPSDKIMNTTSGLCECKAGTTDNGSGTCVATSCDPKTKPSSVQTSPCAGGAVSGSSLTTCAVTCNSASLKWITGGCTTDYSACSCPYAGQKYTTSAGCSCVDGQYLIANSSGTISCGHCSAGSKYDSQTMKCVASCTQDEVLKATRSYFSTETTSEEVLALACIDTSAPNLADNLPTDDARLIRFFNTCGNRYCKFLSPLKGYTEGRVVERNNGLLLECRKTDPPPEISDACRQKLLLLPPAIMGVFATDTQIDANCADAVTPIGKSLPESSTGLDLNLKQIRWIFTCSSRYCRSLNKGYTSGRMTERNGGQNYINCYNEEVFNNLEAGTIVKRFSTTIDELSTACIDSANTTKEANYPNLNAHQALRFVNTCGRRFCKQQLGYSGGSGYVTEIRPESTTYGSQSVEVICYK